MNTQREWPVAFFDDDYLRIYRPQFTPERTAAEVKFIEDQLALTERGSVLDLGCGYGRHAVGMAQRGYRVSGLDFNPHYLDIARQEADAKGVQVTWTEGDMRKLPFTEPFDGVYSYFTSFGYFSDADNERVLAEIGRVTRAGGRFLIDLMNRDWLLTHPQQRTWTQRDDGALLMEETDIELPTSRVVSRQILIEPGGGPQVTKEFFLRAYTCAELSALLVRHGFHVRSVFGSIGGGPHTTESTRLVVLSERSGDGR